MTTTEIAKKIVELLPEDGAFVGRDRNKTGVFVSLVAEDGAVYKRWISFDDLARAKAFAKKVEKKFAGTATCYPRLRNASVPVVLFDGNPMVPTYNHHRTYGQKRAVN